ncbi:putative cobalt-factor III C(17)-methyltransferase [bioreactor metagenome]|uniref:Putative cobalt-factor III C(17)-methyltransferase n=1 Tax=bioreactor metagenome TaxID=1076179 RepID=A0A645FUE0_9ZZZZ
MNKIYVVGIGPGEYEQMTIKAAKCLENCDVIVGYTVYVDLIKEYFGSAKFLSTPMKQEKERCVLAFSEAQKGQSVAVVCSGDSGVYGMASLIFEIGEEYLQTKIEVISGTTAALSGGALLGAPLTHDFAVISLSDLLTPWEKIEKRIRTAAEGDFVICIYNPSSKKRSDYLKRACELVMESKSKKTICGVVRNIGRNGEETETMTLEELSQYQADMFTTAFIGNSETRIINDKMVTPRGYRV